MRPEEYSDLVLSSDPMTSDGNNKMWDTVHHERKYHHGEGGHICGHG